MQSTSTTSWNKQLRHRFVYIWPLKAAATMGFMALFFSIYFAVLANPIQNPIEMPLTWLDLHLAFTPSAYGIYISLWAYVSLPAALQHNFRNLVNFGYWIAIMCSVGLMIFWIIPTKTPIFDIDWSLHPELALIKGLDATGNACPSMHVATAVFSLFWIDAIFKNIQAPWALRCLNLLHCTAILWSTVAIRQHVVLDVAAGAAIGVFFAYASLRHKSMTI